MKLSCSLAPFVEDAADFVDSDLIDIDRTQHDSEIASPKEPPCFVKVALIAEIGVDSFLQNGNMGATHVWGLGK